MYIFIVQRVDPDFSSMHYINNLYFCNGWLCWRKAMSIETWSNLSYTICVPSHFPLIVFYSDWIYKCQLVATFVWSMPRHVAKCFDYWFFLHELRLLIQIFFTLNGVLVLCRLYLPLLFQATRVQLVCWSGKPSQTRSNLSCAQTTFRSRIQVSIVPTEAGSIQLYFLCSCDVLQRFGVRL